MSGDFPDFEDTGSGNGTTLWVEEFQVHASPDESCFEHGAAPSGAVEADEDGLRAEDGVPFDPSVAVAAIEEAVGAVFGFQFQFRAGEELIEADTAEDFGFDDAGVEGFSEGGMGGGGGMEVGAGAHDDSRLYASGAGRTARQM